MASDLEELETLVDRLTARERRVVLMSVGVRVAVLTGVVGLFVVGVVNSGWSRGWATGAVTLAIGLGVWSAIGKPIRDRWKPAGDVLRQARLVEASDPELRGRLVTAVEHLDGATGSESPLLLNLMASRAATRLREHPAPPLHDRVWLMPALAVSLVFAMTPLLAGWFVGPSHVAGWWFRGSGAQMAAILGQDLVDGPKAQVGDLVLRYTYPAYTGLDPKVVQNSTGDVEAVPGTIVQVTARAAEALDAGGLEAYGDRFEAELVDERTLQGRFTVRPEEGAYALLTYQDGQPLPSREFKIVPRDDLPPEVMLDGPDDVVELAVDEAWTVQWRARDDFGVASVAIELDGQPIGGPIYRSESRQAEAFGRLTRSPAELGLSPGAHVKFTVTALDNDTVSGAKVGVSRVVELVILGSKGVGERSEVAAQELIETMLDVLADHLEEPYPPGRLHRDVAKWSEVVARRYQPLSEVAELRWGMFATNGLERTVVESALETGGELVRFGAVTFEVGSKERLQREDEVELTRLRDAAIESLEDAILALDRKQRNRALREVVDVAESMEEIGQDLEELLAAPDVDALQLLAKLDQLEAKMRELAKANAKLDEGGLQEFVNARQNEAKDLMSEIKKAISEGRMEDAKRLMERLSQQLQQMAEGVRDTLERQKGEGDQSMEEAESLKEEIQAIEKEQLDLQEQVDALQKEEEASQANQLWLQVVEQATLLETETQTYAGEVEEANRAFGEVQRAGAALLQARQLRAAAQLQDLRGSRNTHRALEFSVSAMRRAFNVFRSITPDAAGPGTAALDSMDGRLATIDALLEQLENTESDPSTQAAASELKEKQEQLQKRLESAAEQAKELAKDFPVRPKNLQESLENADQRMEDASSDLGDGKPQPAKGSQGAAAQRLKEAAEALDQAMEQARQQQEGLEPGGSGKDGKGKSNGKGEERDEGGRDSNDPPEVEIPGAEQFRTPEEYRKALLEGMEGDVPDAYRALKKRYFEELVRQ